MIVRAFRSSDVKSVIQIAKDNFEFPWTQSQFESEVANENGCSFIIEIDDVIKGFFIGHSLFGEIELLDIAIEKELHGKGVGQFFLREVFKNIDSKESCFLEVSDENFRAISFYKKNEFHIISERKNYYKDGSNALIMKKTFKE